MTVAFEYHAGTLTDTAASANALLAAIDDPRVRTLWQPPIGMAAAECERTLRAVLDRLEDVHVFHWWPDHRTRRPLEAGPTGGADTWRLSRPPAVATVRCWSSSVTTTPTRSSRTLPRYDDSCTVSMVPRPRPWIETE